MSAQHTPGPWTFGYYGCNGYCINGSGQHIATSILYKKDGGEANARLIAAAPELLAALSEALVYMKYPRHASMALVDAHDGALIRARAAIAKATGAAS